VQIEGVVASQDLLKRPKAFNFVVNKRDGVRLDGSHCMSASATIRHRTGCAEYSSLSR